MGSELRNQGSVLISEEEMPWHPELAELFTRVDHATANENEYRGPYNMLLAHLFPNEEGYIVHPEHKYLPDSTDYGIAFIIRVKELRPVFFLELKAYSDLKDIGTRAIADREMRERFERLVNDLSIPKLYGLSAMGPRFAVYEYTVATRVLNPEPAAIAKHSRLDIGEDVAPASRWEYDVLEPAGEAKMREIVQAVKDMYSTVRLRGNL